MARSLATLVALFLCSSIYADALTRAGSLNTARYQHTAVLLPDGRVLILGGTGPYVSGGLIRSAEVFEPETASFRVVGDMTVERHPFTATLLRDGRVLIAGGDAAGTAEIFDPDSGEFRSIASMTAPRTFHTATLLYDGTVLIAGGFNGLLYPESGAQPLDTTEIFDPAAGTFSPGPPLLWKRAWHAATLMSDGRVLLTGGIREVPVGGEAVINRGAEFVDTVARTASPAPLMQFERYAHQGLLLHDGLVALVGGIAYLPEAIGISRPELYNAFTGANDRFEAPSGAPAVLLPNGRILFAGPRLWIGDPATRSSRQTDFAIVGPEYFYLERPSVTLLRDGRVFVAGGYHSGGSHVQYGPVADAWIYIPDPPTSRRRALAPR